MKQKKVIYPIIVGLIVVGFFSCILAFAIEGATKGFSNKEENFDRITETRDIKDFNKISIEGNATLEITQGDNESLTIEATEKEMKAIEASVSNHTLTLRNSDKLSKGVHIDLFKIADRINAPVIYNLTVKDLSQVDTKGAGNITIVGNFTSKDFSFNSQGAGNFSAYNVDIEKLTISMQGAGNTDISGKVNKAFITMEGAGNYEAKNLITKDIEVETNGAGNATVNATDTLNAKVRGVGNIEYYGSPKVTKSINGIGNIESIK